MHTHMHARAHTHTHSLSLPFPLMPLISSAIWMFEQQNNLIRQLARTLPKRPALSSHTVSVCRLPPTSPVQNQWHRPHSQMCTASFYFFSPPLFLFSSLVSAFHTFFNSGDERGIFRKIREWDPLGIVWKSSDKTCWADGVKWRGERGCWGVGKGMYPLAAPQKTCKINMFESKNRNGCWTRSVWLSFTCSVVSWLKIEISPVSQLKSFPVSQAVLSSSCHW